METPSTPSDGKRTRRWPLAAAAGLLAGGLVTIVAFQVFTRASPDERATDLARRMVITQDLSEIEATIIPQFEQETGCHIVFYLPFYGPTLDDVARRATRFVHRLRDASRGTSTTATGLGVGGASGKSTQSDSVREAEYRYVAMVTTVDCEAPYLDAGFRLPYSTSIEHRRPLTKPGRDWAAVVREVSPAAPARELHVPPGHRRSAQSGRTGIGGAR